VGDISHDELDLPMKSFAHLFESLKLARVAGLHADLLPVVTSHFKPALFFTQDWIPH
jgi:hypothetical protein